MTKHPSRQNALGQIGIIQISVNIKEQKITAMLN